MRTCFCILELVLNDALQRGHINCLAAAADLAPGAPAATDGPFSVGPFSADPEPVDTGFDRPCGADGGAKKFGIPAAAAAAAIDAGSTAACNMGFDVGALAVCPALAANGIVGQNSVGGG